MAHPQMFDDGDPILARVRKIALALPRAQEKTSHGRPFFYTKSGFAVYGGGPKDKHKDVENWRQTLLFSPDPSEATALSQDERFFVPAYYGPGGWLGLRLGDGDVDWDEVRELITDSWRQFVPPTVAREYERG
ncbi:MAG: MmcQ/YjbR family DNA-binding protein [bacterium]|nr:MmcQ/YjbR family DNA-binding protein [bacterium]